MTVGYSSNSTLSLNGSCLPCYVGHFNPGLELGFDHRAGSSMGTGTACGLSGDDEIYLVRM
jgi:hypothetical protein